MASSSSAATTTNIQKDDDQGEEHQQPASSNNSLLSAEKWSDSSPLVQQLQQQSTNNQDPYIAASPLSVAAICSDGIALVSLHYNVDVVEERSASLTAVHDTDAKGDVVDDVVAENSGDKDEKIHDGVSTTETSLVEKEDESNTSCSNTNNNNKQLPPFRDLPLSSRGPLRIEPIYENTNYNYNNNIQQQTDPPPMALLTAGWRTDGITLCNAGRELMGEEVRLYCLPATTSTSSGSIIAGGGGQQTSYYGRRIAGGLSYYLSKCEFSEGVRSLSTVGLLACGSSSTTSSSSKGSLYLIDATGIHPIRAHAIGNGSNTLHERLVRINFDNMDCIEGLRVLIRLIGEEGSGLIILPRSIEKNHSGGVLDSEETETVNGHETLQDTTTKSIIKRQPYAFLSKKGKSEQQQPGNNMPSAGEAHLLSDDNDSRRQKKWTIPSNTAVELAVIKNGEGRMKRIRLSSL